MNWLRTTAPILLCALVVGCAAKAQPPAHDDAVAIAIEPARPAQSPAVYSGPGTVAAQHTYRIAFEIPGRVIAVNADVGDRVAAGETLAALDGSDYGAQLRAANARADEAAANAAKAHNGARPGERAAAAESVASAQAQLDRAEAAARLADTNARRLQSLYVNGDVSAQANDTAATAAQDASGGLAAARAQLAAAQAQRALVDEGPRDEDLHAAAAEADAARASADNAAVTLAKTTLVAPAGAYVLSRNIEPGSDAQPGQLAFVLVDARDPDVLVAVPSARIGGVRLGMRADVGVDGRRYSARVERFEPSADPTTRTAFVRLRVVGLHAADGSVAHVVLGARQALGASVPLGAVIDRQGTRTVAVYEGAHRTVAYRAVHVISVDGDRAIVRGIALGESVVVAGQYEAHPGDPVRVVTLEGASS
jgi:HlyD family secretion protein